MRRLIAALALLLAGEASAAVLVNPFGVRWGASPQEVQYYMVKTGFKFLGPTELGGDTNHFLHEHRYEGNLLGQYSDHIAPLFFGGHYFGMAVSVSPSPKKPASLIWEEMVSALTRQYGPPTSKVKPTQMVSLISVLKLLPDGEIKGKLMQMYAAADKNREIGPYMLQDLEIRVGTWVPDATWKFDNNVVVKAVMRAGWPDQYGLTALKPCVLYSNYDFLR